MAYIKESEMYPPVCGWLKHFLSNKYPGWEVQVFDSSRESLAKLIQKSGLIANLPLEWPSWDIHIDIVGFSIKERVTELAFVECKNVPITLGHLSQLLGYSRVAQPQHSFIISPRGPSDSLKSLLVTFRRTDILEYHQLAGRLGRSIVVATWNETAKSIDYGSMIGGDASYLGRL